MNALLFERPVWFATGPSMLEEEAQEMEHSTYHRPVLATEVIDLLTPRPGSLVVDATCGGGGHTEAILATGADVLALDQDPDAIEEATRKLANFGGRVTFRQINFRYADQVLDEIKRAVQFWRQRDDGLVDQQSAVLGRNLSIVDQHSIEWQNRAQFFGVAAQLIRRILVDHVRNRRTAKRGAGALTVTLDDAVSEPVREDIDLVKLDDALLSLAANDEQQSRVVELRFFGGLSIEETAEVLAMVDWARAASGSSPWSPVAPRTRRGAAPSLDYS